MASADDTITDHEPVRSQVTADLVAPLANVPWAPAETVYRHQDESVADANDHIDDLDCDDPADFGVASPARAPSRLRRAVPLLWAAALTLAALQHAGEVERRAARPEPSSAELQMQDRSEPEIRAAWRNVGAEAKAKPVEHVSAEGTAEPVVAKREEIIPVAASKAFEAERPLVEPITEVGYRTEPLEKAEEPSKAAAEQPAPEDSEGAVATTKSEIQAKTDVVPIVQPSMVDAEPARPARKGRVTTSHAPRQHIPRSAKAARRRQAQGPSTKYVMLDGLKPRYITIERPARNSP